MMSQEVNRKRKLGIRAGSLALAFAVVFAACGKGNGSGSNGPTGKYIAFGNNVTSVGLSSTSTPESYDASSGGWTALAAPTGTAVTFAGFTALSGGKLLLAGGGPSGGPNDSSTTTNAAQIFDPTAGAWTTTGAMVRDRNQFSIVKLSTGDAMAIGGCAGGCSGPSLHGQMVSTVGNSAEIYSVSSGTWTLKANLSKVRASNPAAITLANGNVLVCGGTDGFSAIYADCEVYNTSANSWSSTGSMAAQDRGFTWGRPALLTGGKVLLAHMSGQSAPEIYDPNAGAWSAAGSLVTARSGAQVLALNDGRAVIVGGANPTGPCSTILASVEIYNPSTNAWTAAGSLSKGRSAPGVALLSDGRVLVTGGTSSCTGTLETSSEIYDPSSQTTTPTGAMATARGSFFPVLQYQ